MNVETQNIKEAAKFLCMSTSALRAKIKSGEIKAAKPAKQWVFLKEDLVAYIRSIYYKRVEMPSSDSQKELQLCYTDAKKYGGLDLQHRMDSEYADLLELKIES